LEVPENLAQRAKERHRARQDARFKVFCPGLVKGSGLYRVSVVDIKTPQVGGPSNAVGLYRPVHVSGFCAIALFRAIALRPICR